jgi:GNAT superfamily N-acetyltransferase
MHWTIHRHFKGNLYLELGSGLHSETKEPLVLYRSLYHNDLGATWLRPAPSFHGTTPDGARRFQPIGTLQSVPPSSLASLPEDLRSAEQARAHTTTFVLHLPDGTAASSIVTQTESLDRTRILDLRTLPSRRRQGHATTLLRATMGLVLHQAGGNAPEHRFVSRTAAPHALFAACGFHPSTHGEHESAGI